MPAGDPFCPIHQYNPCSCQSQPEPVAAKTPTQQELRKHCREVLGMSEEAIGEEEIPPGVLFLSKRPLTEAEEKYAQLLFPTIK